MSRKTEIMPTSWLDKSPSPRLRHPSPVQTGEGIGGEGLKKNSRGCTNPGNSCSSLRWVIEKLANDHQSLYLLVDELAVCVEVADDRQVDAVSELSLHALQSVRGRLTDDALALQVVDLHLS